MWFVVAVPYQLTWCTECGRSVEAGGMCVCCWVRGESALVWCALNSVAVWMTVRSEWLAVRQRRGARCAWTFSREYSLQNSAFTACFSSGISFHLSLTGIQTVCLVYWPGVCSFYGLTSHLWSFLCLYYLNFVTVND